MKNLIIRASTSTDDVQYQPSTDGNFGGRERTSQERLFEVAGLYVVSMLWTSSVGNPGQWKVGGGRRRTETHLISSPQGLQAGSGLRPQSMLGGKAEEGSGSATGSNIWARSRRLLCLAGAPEGPSR